MNVIVRCPSCDRPATVPEADAFDVPIACAGCGTVYEPQTATPVSEPAPAAPKIPGYGPHGKVPRPAAPRPREPDEREPDADRFTRRAVAVGAVGLFGLAATAGVGLWAAGRANRGAAGAGAGGAINADGAPAGAVPAGDGWRVSALSEAPDVTLEYPAPPSAVDERVDYWDLARGRVTGTTSFRAFKCVRSNGETYAVRVDPVDWSVLRVKSDAACRKEKLLAFAKLLRGADWDAARQRDAIPVSGYDSDECFLPVVTGGRSAVFRSVLVYDCVYTMYVAGPGVSPDAPDVRRFFDSFRHTRIPPEPSAPPVPSGPLFRPLACLPAHIAAAFSPQQDAVFLSCPFSSPAGGLAGERVNLVRYHYPSFRREASVQLDSRFRGEVVDERAGVIYGLASRYDLSKDLHAFGFAAYKIPTADARPEEPVRARDWTKTLADYVLLSPDRRRLYVSFIPPRAYSKVLSEGTFWSIDPSTGKRLVELKLHTGAPLSASPDGARLYTITHVPTTAAGFSGHGIAEIDPNTLEVLRKIPLRSDLTHLVALGGDRLLGLGGGSSDFEWKSVLIDLNADRQERLTERSAGIRQHALRGDRLYTCGHEVVAWDVSDAAAGRVRRLEAKPQRAMCVSPDGKCLIAGDGRVYWLGDGPLPKIDPEASWDR